MLQEQTVVGDCYILQSRAGEDTCSEYWMATAIFSAKRFLLRFLKTEYAKAEKIETLRKRAIESYHIRGDTIKDFVEIENFDGRLFISSEYYDERSLSDFFSLGYTMSLVHICKSIRMIAQGLLCFHEVGILYGNLSPENIVVEIKGSEISTVKLVKPSLLCDAASTSSAYLAPECKAGKAPSRGSDIYSLGILIVRFITGFLPFEDGDVTRNEPSLRYVTNALFRRGIPEKMVRIVLGMLMTSPAVRYDSCTTLLNDLHHFMSLPGDLTPRDSAQDEIRILPASRPAFKSFDTTDYFNTLSNGPNNLDHAYDRVYPVKKIDDFADADKIEREEMRILPEEANWSIDDYISYGKQNVAGIHEGLSQEETESEAIKSEASELADSPVRQTEPAMPASQVAPQTSIQSENSSRSASVQAALPILPDINGTGIGQLTVKDDGVPEKRTWSYHRIQIKDVYNIIDRSAQLASKGRGSFRYIQEPESGYADNPFYESLGSLSGGNLYVNVGSCARYGTAGLDEFLVMLRKSFASVLAKESRSFVSRLANKISRFDDKGYFRLPPLGKILYGNSSVSSSGPVSPDMESLRAIANSVCAFSSKKRPLVLVIRGGERINPDLQNFFSVLSGAVSTQSVCVVVFFDHIAFEPWQTLSLLSKPQRFDNAG